MSRFVAAGALSITIFMAALEVAPTANAQSTTDAGTTPPPTSVSAEPAGKGSLEVRRNRGSNGTAFSLDLSSSAPATGTDGASSSNHGFRRTAAPPRYVAHFPALVPDAGGGYCIQPQRRYFSERRDAVAYDVEQEQRWLMLVRNYELCSHESAPGVPAAEASQYWRQIGEDLLPRPQPRMAPGFMLAGKLGYLEANTPITAHYEHATPLGPLVIEATSTLWVDWGDHGGLDGPFAGPGAPWPNGTITHFWTDADRYDIRVVQRWTATWALGGRRGQLAGLTTEGRIDDFEVRQLQAVINR